MLKRPLDPSDKQRLTEPAGAYANSREAEISVSRATEYERCRLMTSTGVAFLNA